MTMTVGVIGLGPMGGNIARLLLERQFKVSGFDLNPDCMAALDDTGLDAAASVTEVAANADVIITSLPSAGALDAVIDGISEHDRAGQIVIECSTLTVDQKIAAHGRLAEAGKNMLDSPISATPAMLAKMMASIHISGDEAAYQECIAVFEGFTASNFYVGPVGNGSRMKILANYLVHVNTTAAAECMALGQKAGLDPDMIYEVLCKSAGTSKMFEIRGAMMAKSDYREGGGTMFAIYEKDSSIITEFAAQMKSPIDLYVSSRQKMNSAMALGLGHLDTSAVCKAIEVAAGIDRKLVE
ncbi:MAG: 2-(hydroxymethyl)glutarate dehydrogenase [Alphaproteobacteria bacterium MarineAlpha3_Bin2]|jgi:3-hydroxyisobutyrate dehydrogenase|nr:MAG: 2-(hydroxymethyl)glutarate dehydrogenase [Alphaproteobacteria bacterium MarineAlpha3_Bin1]PPR71268.1 MAG: 2-(hydroxymethyl)glutarate dehydrogenase [Alphaproteobacteria bacterium MarineAlpha3_Bin2]